MGGPGLREGGKSCNEKGKGVECKFFFAQPDPPRFSPCYYFYTLLKMSSLIMYPFPLTSNSHRHRNNENLD